MKRGVFAPIGLVAAGIFWASMVAPVLADNNAVEERLVLEAARAAQYGEMRFSFTVDFEQAQDKKNAAFTAHYDPRLEEGAQWSLEGVSLDDLDEHSRDTFESLSASHRGDDGIVYDKLGENLGEEVISKLALQSETDVEAIFTAPLIGDDAPEGVLEIVMYFDKQHDYVSRIDVRTIEDFKPNPAVKINSMRQSQYFSPPGESGGPALLSKTENETSGSAFFKKFKSDTKIVYSNVQIVDVPAVAVGEASLE